MKKSGKRQGQGMTEYVVIVGLVSILMVGAVTRFKAAVEGSYVSSADLVQRRVTDRINSAR